MKMMKTIGALALVLCMMVGMLPFQATAAEGSAQIVSQQLSLGDDLTMRFGVAVDSQYPNAEISVSVAGSAKTYNVAELTAKDGIYTVSVDLAAAQMTDAITVTVTDSETQLVSKQYSVQAYCQYLLNGNYTDATKQMVLEVLNYGTKAQLYFDYNSTNLANAGNELETVAAVPTEGYDLTTEGGVSGITFRGASLVFQGKIAVRYYFSASDISGYTFTVNGVPYETQENQDGLFYVEVPGINPQQYADMIHLTVSDGIDSLVVGYSPLSYIVRMYAKDTTSATLKNLLVAMYGYYLEASAFTGVEEILLPITINGHSVIGKWKDNKEGSASLGAHNTYDGNTTGKDANNGNDMWNPELLDFQSGPGVIYALDKVYNVKTMVMYTHRIYYFDVYGSYDGVNYTLIARVGSSNVADYYSGQEGDYLCDLTGLQSENVKYLKVAFTGCADVGATHLGIFEIELSGTESAPVSDDREEKKGTIVAHQLLGTWIQDREGNSTIGPQKSYDSDTASLWNPQANNYKSGEGIIFALDKAQDITQLTLTFKTRQYYFNLYVSSNGVDYLPVATVTADNASTYFDGVVATLPNMTTANVNYIKVMFTGNAGALNTFISLCDVAVTCKDATVAEDTRPVVDAPIIGHTLIGTWKNDYATSTSLGPQQSYDGNAADTYWQGEVNNYTSGAGIIYQLDEAYDLKTITLTQRQRPYYFNLYVSADGENYLPLMNVNKDNYTQYYVGNVCTIDGITNQAVKYVKLVFTGNIANSTWTGLSEVALTGVSLAEVEPETVGVSGAFSSHMVLQRNAQIPVWGWAEAGVTVTGDFAGAKVTTTADETGYWKLLFPAQEANTTGQTMTITDSRGNQEVFTDILIGDVYIINGQSNAELSVQRTASHLDPAGKETVREQFRYDTNIRLFHQIKAGVVERSDLWAEPQADVINPDWSWTVAAENDNFWLFSALGMYFAQSVRKSVDVPIGLIQTAAGGAFIDELMPNELNEQFRYTGSHTVTVGGYYNTMMHPFVGYPISGMLFFQGESNNFMMADEYDQTLTAYIQELRSRWGINFHFYNVQLSSYGQQQVDQGIWPYLPDVRNMQYQILDDVDNYYLTVSMDKGYAGEVDQGTNLQDAMHPKDKKTLGERVAKQALAVYYNVLEVGEDTFSPVPSDIQWNTDGILISFHNADTLALATGDSLVGFQVVINEEVVDVAAQIVNGNQVLLPVDATTVSEIRYAMFFLCYPEDANLINGGGLPAPGFAIANPGKFTTNKVVIKRGTASDTGWLSLGVAAALPYHSFDGNLDSYWNPQVNDFSKDPAITYQLNVPADISGLTVHFMKRMEYFTLYASTDGVTFTEVMDITADHYTEYVCNVTGLELKNVKALKLVFTGSSDGSKWIGMYELQLDAVPAVAE